MFHVKHSFFDIRLIKLNSINPFIPGYSLVFIYNNTMRLLIEINMYVYVLYIIMIL